MPRVGLPQFRAFTLKFDGRVNRIISDVSVCAGFDPGQPPEPLPEFITTRALWDTGATGSCISPEVSERLKLTPVGKARVNHAGGGGETDIFLVNLLLPNRVQVAGVAASQLRGTHDFGAIIGMDIISSGDFAITHAGGRACMSFRIPPCQTIDYVAAANAVQFAKVGRNDPCPCGRKSDNGAPVKYKHCHGAPGARA